MRTKMISIVTAVYNGGRLLQSLINSIKEQESKNFEFIIIDGDSKDNTLEVIKANEAYINQWVSEPDRGIYDAWNKGVARATGNWIMFLGCDDQLRPDAIARYEAFIATLTDDVEYISSRMQMVDEQGQLIRIKGWGWEWPRFLEEMTVAHPGSLHSRKFFEKYGIFDPSYRIVGDYELLLRAKGNLKSAFMDHITVHMQEGGASDSFAAVKEHYRAVTQTAGYNEWDARKNMYTVMSKLWGKRWLRKAGINAYLRK